MWMMMIKKENRGARGDSDYPLDANAQNSFFINESGVYSLILRSKKWVPSEVLHLCTF